MLLAHAMDITTDINERVRSWQDAGIIDAAQADRIVAFELGEPDSAAATSPDASHHAARDRMQALFGVLGVLLVGLGVLLTVIANWNSIDDLVKLGLLISSMLIAYVAGVVADARHAPRWVGTIAFAVGMLLFSGGIFIIGALYNIQVHRPLGMLLVAIFGTAIAVLSGRMTVGWIAAIGWLGWGMHELVVSLDDLNDIDGQRMLIQVVAAAAVGSVAALSAGWAMADTTRHADVVGLPLRTLATVGLTGLLVQSTFAWHAHGLLEDATLRPEPWIMGAAALLAAGSMYRLAPFTHRRALAVACGIFCVAALASSLWPQGTFIAVAASGALTIGGVGLVFVGLIESRRELFIWGIAWLSLLVVTRYLDFMTSVDAGGPGFIGAGVLLLIIAVLIGRSSRLWRHREAVMR